MGFIMLNLVHNVTLKPTSEGRTEVNLSVTMNGNRKLKNKQMM